MINFAEYCQMIVENHFQKVIQGSVPIVTTVGIITAENPNLKKLTKTGNERKNKNLEEELNKIGYSPIQMKGKFAGKQENPFLIINIDRNKLVELAEKFNQESVIFGKKEDKKFEFSYIKNGISVKKGFLGIDHPKNLIDSDCYFSLSGKKFNIKFKS